MKQLGSFHLPDHLKRLSEAGDPLEEMARVNDFELFRPLRESSPSYSGGSKGGRAPYDPVAMFKVLILAARNSMSDARMEFLIRDRPGWTRFPGFEPGKATPDENTIRGFRERPTAAGAIRVLFEDFDRRFGFIRGYAATDAARHDGHVPRRIVGTDNTVSDVRG